MSDKPLVEKENPLRCNFYEIDGHNNIINKQRNLFILHLNMWTDKVKYNKQIIPKKVY